MVNYSIRPPWRLWGALLVALAAAGWLGHLSWRQRGVLAAQREELAAAREASGELDYAQRKLAKADQALAACEKARATPTAERGDTEVGVAPSPSGLAATQAELNELGNHAVEGDEQLAALEALSARFQQLIEAKRLEVAMRDGHVIVSLPAGALFPSGDAALSRDGELALMEVAIVIRELDGQLMVAGHTDDRPPDNTDATNRFTDNWELSTARAVAVVSFLINARVRPDKLIAAGFGQHAPISDNSTPAGRARNRRIELVMLPSAAEPPTTPEPKR